MKYEIGKTKLIEVWETEAFSLLFSCILKTFLGQQNSGTQSVIVWEKRCFPSRVSLIH